MKVNYYFFVIAVLTLISGCGARRDRIVVPNTSNDYYIRSVLVLEEELEDDPDNLELIKLQLSYYKNLNWPLSALSAVDRASDFVTVDPDIKDYTLDFYKVNALHREILTVLESLEKINALSDEEQNLKIKSLVHFGRFDEAQNEIDQILQDPGPGDHLLVGQIYSFNRNIPLSLYHYYKAYSLGVRDSLLVFDFAYDLADVGYYQNTREILEAHDQFLKYQDIKFLYANTLLNSGDYRRGIATLKELGTRRAFFTLSDWYQRQNVFDSAVYFANQVVQNDSSDIGALMKVGRIFENRGFFTRSLNYYNTVLKIDSTYSEARDQIAIVNRKIAYLRRIREQEEEVSNPE